MHLSIFLTQFSYAVEKNKEEFKQELQLASASRHGAEPIIASAAVSESDNSLLFGWLLREPPLMALSSWEWPLKVACWPFTALLWANFFFGPT